MQNRVQREKMHYYNVFLKFHKFLADNSKSKQARGLIFAGSCSACKNTLLQLIVPIHALLKGDNYRHLDTTLMISLLELFT